jgi:membrane fusion protein (multidrug efflux system)
MNKRVVMVAVAIGVLCAGLVAFNFVGALLFGGQHFMAPPPTAVEVVTVAPAPWHPGIEAVGTARATQGADIAAEVSGVIKAINVKPNERAKTGEVLIQIDDAVERADLLAAEANMRLYSAQLSRSRALMGKGFVSRASLDTVEAQLGVAKSARERAKAVIGQKAMEAPFAGTVGIARVDVGQYVNAGDVLVTLQDLDRMKIDFTIPEQAAASLKIGQRASFGPDKANLKFEGTVIGIDPKAEPSSRLVAVQAEVTNAAGAIRPGQFVAVRVDLPTEPNVIALPQTAVLSSLYGDFVFVVGPPDPQPAPAPAGQGTAIASPQGPPPALVAKQVFVTTGRRDGRRVEIAKGVNVGDKVVSSGQNRLQNGAAVAIAEPLGKAAEKTPAPAEPAK